MWTSARFPRDGSGATADEYGLLVAGIAVAIMAVINSIGGGLQNTFTGVSDDIANAGR
jgi:pilus assembly protein Flp/PilA